MSYLNIITKVITLPVLLILLASCARSPYVYKAPTGAAAANLFAATGNMAMIPLTITTSSLNGNYKAVKEIFEKYPELKNKNAANSRVRIITNALSNACQAEVINMDLIKYLVKNGADVNGDYRRSGAAGITRSPLSAVLLVIFTKSNVAFQNSMKKVSADMEEINKALGKKSVTPSSLDERYAVLEYLIKAGADVNLKTKTGSPFLLSSGNKRAMTILIKAGADTSEAEKTYRNSIKFGSEKISLLKKYM